MAVAPVVKITGSKRGVVSTLISNMPKAPCPTIHEPFAGGLSLSLACIQPVMAFEANRQLANVHNVVKNDVEALIDELMAFESHYLSLSTLDEKSEYYYALRDEYNCPSFAATTPEHQAAIYITLNKTCFNGLYRVNGNGMMNTPFGKREKPTIVNATNLRDTSVRMQNITVMHDDFSPVINYVNAGDFVFLDPPYLGTFNAYTAEKFSWLDHLRVYDLCERLDATGVYWMLTYPDEPTMRTLYDDYYITTYKALRRISCNASSRGYADEMIITNYPT